MNEPETIQEGVRELTFDERAVWGTCPVCKAGPGTRCDWSVGILAALYMHQNPRGAHLGRLQAAPLRVRVEAVR